jgi:hypothetical protein
VGLVDRDGGRGARTGGNVRSTARGGEVGQVRWPGRRYSGAWLAPVTSQYLGAGNAIARGAEASVPIVL